MLALSSRETTRIAPFIGALIPIFTFIVEYFVLGVAFSPLYSVAFIVLVVGTLVVALDLDTPSGKQHQTSRKDLLPWIYGSAASALFAISFVFSKLVYEQEPFWSGFVWIRLASFVTVLFFLLSPRIRRAVWEARTLFATRNGAVYLSSQIVGAAAFIFINIALTSAPASLVNALQGVQYAFLILLVLVANVVAPKLVKEAMGKKTLLVRSVGVLIIGFGLAIIAYAQ
jgi:drug/metabolite transporter (DMT)-like permease